MPPKCDKCGTVKGKDGTCKVCDAADGMDVESTDDPKINTVQAANADGGGARVRSKSPLVNSAERTSKVARRGIDDGPPTILPVIPLFPKAVEGKGGGKRT